MTDETSTKAAIRRRMFFAAEKRGESGLRFGFQWCPTCKGRGELCVERSTDGSRVAAFEECPSCAGERVVAVDGLPPDTGA
jgi:DnaJ-class molecular chaperone